MEKDIAEIFYRALENYEGDIQWFTWLTEEERNKCYEDHDKAKEWLDVVRIGKFPNALPFKESKCA